MSQAQSKESKDWMKRFLLAVGWVWVLSHLFVGTTAIADTDSEEVSLKLVEGTVSAVNNRGIAVEFAHGDGASNEMYLPFDQGLKLQGFEKVAQIHEGDAVLVEYQETVSKKSEEQEYPLVKRTAVKTTLLKSAPLQKPETESAKQPEEPSE